MPNTTYGTPYVQSSDLVSGYPSASLSLANRLDAVAYSRNGLNAQTGTTYTLVLTDAGKTVTLSNAAAMTLTVPTNASVAFPTDTVVTVVNQGAGTVTISGAGVTFQPSGNITLATDDVAVLQKVATNTWQRIDGLAAKLTTPGAWTSYTPTVTAATGTPTTVTTTGSYQVLGKIVILRFSVGITNKGTAASYLRVSTPASLTPNSDFAGSVFEGSVTGASSGAFTQASTSYISTAKADGTTWWVNSYALQGTIVYSIA